MSTGPSRPASATQISSIEHRVNYSETDQMGLVYHARYVVWFDMARTEHLRGAGFTYRRMEEEGVFLAVTDLRVRYRQPARYDDLVRIRCWVRDLASRRVTFGYAVERAQTGDLLATAETALIALTTRHTLSRIPEHVLALLQTAPDPVRL
jgi:acyl-CoA thioester hydrolase